MAEDASECLASLSQSVSYLAPLSSSFLFQNFAGASQFLSYLILCVVKMPFIPPVSIARSVSGLTGKERSVHSSSSSASKTRDPREDRGSSSVKERLTLNIKQLGKKSQPRSHLPTAGKAALEAPSRRRDRPVPSSQTDSFPASSSGESLSKTKPQKHGTSEAKTRPKPQEVEQQQQQEQAAHFTLTLTPEAVLLLQRRNSERHQRSAARKVADGSVDDPRHRKEAFASKRHPHRHGAPNGRLPAAPVKGVAELGDITSFVKISLLNERHKYDDVEYEDEGDYGVDERVVLKCTEWLRGLENPPVTVGNGLSKSASSAKSF